MSHIKNLTTGSLSSADLMVVGDGTSELKGQTSSTTMMYNTTGSLTTQPNGALIPIYGYPVQQSQIGQIFHQPTQQQQAYVYNKKSAKILTNKRNRDFKSQTVTMNNVLPSNTAVGSLFNSTQTASIAHSTNFDWTKDWSFSVSFRTGSVVQYLVQFFAKDNWSSGVGLLYHAGNKTLYVYYDNSNNKYDVGFGLIEILPNRNYHIVFTKTLSHSTLYVDGILLQQRSTPFVFENNLNNVIIGSSQGYSHNGNIFSNHFFNYALTPAEVSLLWNNGRPDKAKLKSYQKWGSNTNLKPSQFKKGKVYKITNNTGSNFTLYGASNNEIGTVFTCNNDFNITNNNGYAIQLGCVASYTSKGLVYNSSLQVNRWLDDSSNKLHADISGDPLVQSIVVSQQGSMCDIGNTVVAMEKTGIKRTVTSRNVCDVSNDFTIAKMVNVKETRVSGATPIILKNNGLFLYVDVTGDNKTKIQLGNQNGDGYQTIGGTVAPTILYSFSPEYQNKNVFYVVRKEGLVVSVYVNNVVRFTALLLENIGNNANNFDDNLEIVKAIHGCEHFFNYALTPAEVSLLWNHGRPDRAVLPEYMKWGSNENIGMDSATVDVGLQVTNLTANGFSAKCLNGDLFARIYKPIPVLSNYQGKMYRLKFKFQATSIPEGEYDFTQFRFNDRSNLAGSPATYVKIIIFEKNTSIQHVDMIVILPSNKIFYYGFIYGGVNLEYTVTDFQLIQLGSVASYTAKGLITDASGKCTNWETDKKIETGTDDSLTATITGSPDLVQIQTQYKNQQYITQILPFTATNASIKSTTSMPYNYVIDSILLQKTSGESTANASITINGTSASNTISTLPFSSSNPQTNLYGFSLLTHTLAGNLGLTLGSSFNGNLTIIYKRINR